MQKIHLHRPGWMHKPDWHTMGTHLEHIIHDPRFWAAIALAILLGLMILTTIFSEPGTYSGHTPIYPYLP